MKEFKDAEGRAWPIAMNVTAIQRVRDLVGVDLLTIFDGTLIPALASDPVKLCNVLYALCKKEADRREVSDEEFGEAMYGDVIANATQALLDELVNFLSNPRDRAALAAIWTKAQTAMERGRDVVERQIQNGAIDRLIDREIANLESRLESAGNGSTTAPGSSGLTPDPSASAS